MNTHDGEASNSLATNKTVLVTGGAGYIGSHACKALRNAGYRPVVLDNLSYGHEWAVKWGELEIGDLRDEHRLTEIFVKHAPQAVMHFAALANVGHSVEDPAAYYNNNVVGTHRLLEAMRSQGVRTIIFSSSAATYGHTQTLPIPEAAVQVPINPYGQTKLMGERMLADYCSAYGFSATSLRYFNAAGADPDCEIGECHDPETHLVPLVLGTAAGTQPHITVFGTDYDTPDGTCLRDYLHVWDIAMAHISALERVGEPGQFNAYNLGTGRGYSVREVIDAARRVTKKPIKTLNGVGRPGDPATLVADPGQAHSQLNWRPEHSSLEEIVATAWAWTQLRSAVEVSEIPTLSAGR